jgi:bifunctional non-homologous end joining protein LigD
MPAAVKRRKKARGFEADTIEVAVPGSRKAPMPDQIQPMLATLVDEPFSDKEWIYETKWDGVRAVCRVSDGKVQFTSRNNNDITHRYPELQEIVRLVNAEEAILDGELVAFADNGKPSFQLLQQRMGLENRKEIEKLSSKVKVVYYAFDLLYMNGFDLTQGQLIHRKALLEQIVESDELLKYSEHVVEDGKALFKKAAKEGLEGIIAKHQASSYVQRRSSDWLKIKTQLRQEVVIAGYTEPRGSRKHIGALIVGLYENGKLYYSGHVGGGFNLNSLEQTIKLLKKLETKRSPFEEVPRTNEPVHWVKPKLVCEVKFAEWTSDRRMRQPIFLGLRDDKDPAECTLEKKRKAKVEVKKVEEEISLKGT